MDTLKAVKPGEVQHRSIRCTTCHGVFDHVRKYVAHLRQGGVDELSECEQIRRGLV